MRIIVRFAGPLVTLLGVGLGMYGTFLVSRFYHSFRPKIFWITVFKTLWHFLTFRKSKAVNFIEIAVKVSLDNKEDKPTTLLGYYLIFWGFAFQGLGALLWEIDSSIP